MGNIKYIVYKSVVYNTFYKRYLIRRYILTLISKLPFKITPYMSI